MATVVIIGAGISGLSLAYRLRQRIPAASITVLEQLDRPGGTAWTERQNGFQVEIGPNGFLDTKPSTLALCRDIGMGARLLAASEAAQRKRYLFVDGKLRRVPSDPLAFLGTKLLSWRGKLAFLLERFRRPRRDNVDESIDEFARRRAGAEVADVVADAIVTGIHAGDPKLLSVKATFPQLVDLEQQYGSVMRGRARQARQRRAEAKARGERYQRPKMWSFREGLRLLVETLSAQLSQPPLLSVNVKAVRKAEGAAWTVAAEGRDQWPADAVVLTCPANEQATILADLDAPLAERVGGIPYNRVAVVALGYRRTDVPLPLDGFGYIAPQRTRRDLLGVQWCSSIFPDRAPQDAVLLRALCGGWHRGDVVGWEDARLLEAMRAELRLAMGIAAAPVFHRIIRWERAIPQYHVGHLERVAWIEQRLSSHPGLFLGGNAYRGVALNDCTEQAEGLAGRIQRYLAGGATS
jgi:oxygen-dependent protoporphyrinogen oxidase